MRNIVFHGEWLVAIHRSGRWIDTYIHCGSYVYDMKPYTLLWLAMSKMIVEVDIA